ncbi:MAG TPA: DUF5658 family protein [Chthonomonadales bacterium]|nr:DUF5658 family protein [Chthonomonadales bacterium]
MEPQDAHSGAAGLRLTLSEETGILAAIGIADTISTVLLVASGRAVEANPIMKFYMGAGLISFVVSKLILVVSPLVALELLRRRRPKSVKLLMRVGIALYIISYVAGIWRVNAAHAYPSRNARSASERSVSSAARLE